MSVVPKRGQFKPSSAPPRTVQTISAKSDSVPNAPGDDGTSNNKRNRTAIRAPAMPRIFSPAEGAIASADRILPEAREMTKIEAKKYATVMPAEVMSTSQLEAALPNHGVAEHSVAKTRMENTGVPEVRDSERKAGGIIVASPMVDSTREDAAMNPFSPVSTPAETATTTRTMAVGPHRSVSASAGGQALSL